MILSRIFIMMDEVIINRIFFIIIIILIALLYFSVDENVRLSDVFTEIKDELSRTRLDFKTETAAVCEDALEGKYCHDELFVTCGGIKHRIVNVNGSIIVDNEQQDKR